VTLFQALGIFASGGAGAAAAPGMVLMNPTSIAYSGTSATLGANGQVTFSAVTSLSLNGCFTADFDNYVVSISGTVNANSRSIGFQLRSSGSDATGTDYTIQVLSVNNTTVTGTRTTANSSLQIGYLDSSYPSGTWVSVYGPYLAQPTATRSTAVRGTSGAVIDDRAATHSLSTSYDGFTVFINTDNMTGALQVYGVRS
jgi:hypothetical protein